MGDVKVAGAASRCGHAQTTCGENSLPAGVIRRAAGLRHPLVEYGLMGAAMALPMVRGMRFRGHPWSDGLEMTAAMLLPIFAVALPAALGLGGPTGDALMLPAHGAMIAGMIALMLVRRDRYPHGARHR